MYSDTTKTTLVGYVGKDGHVEIPDGTTAIGEQAFYGNTIIESVRIPATVENVGSMAFGDCPSLTAISVDPTNQTYDSREDCNAVIETGIGRLVAGCKDTVVPGGVTEIGNRAFFKCDGLVSVTLPDTVASIGEAAFHKCTGLTSITCMATTPPTMGIGMLDDTNDCPIYVPAVSVSRYKKAASWKSYASRIRAVTC